MRPVVNGLKQKYDRQVRFAELNSDDKNNWSQVGKFRIVGHPSFVLVDGQGNLIKRWTGMVAQSDLENAFTPLVKQ